MNLWFQRSRVHQRSVRQSRRSSKLSDHVFTTAQRREWTGSREKLYSESPSPRNILALVSLFLINLPKVFKYLSLWGTFLIQTIMFCKAKNLTANISLFPEMFLLFLKLQIYWRSVSSATCLKIIYITINFEEHFPGCRILVYRTVSSFIEPFKKRANFVIYLVTSLAELLIK